MTTIQNRQSGAFGLGVYLALIQFLFAICWLVYIIYLGDLLEQVGIGRSNLPWIILIDQLIFVAMDTAMGFNADRVGRVIGKIGPWIVAVNAVSCIAFACIPLVTDFASPALFMGIVILWVASASVLRAPPLVLLSKHASKPKMPWLIGLSLSGLALGGALSPYLGIWLKQQSPVLPFVISAAALWITTLGLVWAERRKGAGTEDVRIRSLPKLGSKIGYFLLAGLLLGLGFQVYFFLNTKPQFLSYVTQEDLSLYLPLFWVGFNLLVFPGAAIASRIGAMKVLPVAALITLFGSAITAYSTSLHLLIIGQIITGGGWGVIFMAGITASYSMGIKGREGLVMGLWFSMLALAAVIRVGMVLLGVKKMPDIMELLEYLPTLSWVMASLLLFFVLVKTSPHFSPG